MMVAFRHLGLLSLFILLFGEIVEHAISKKILVVGSINADTFLPVARLPVEGENLTLLPGKHPSVDVPGGKGCTQAIAASKLLLREDESTTVSFVGQFGNDAAAQILRRALLDANVDITHCGNHDNLPSGRGYVFLTESGSVSAIVTGGSNLYGWEMWRRVRETPFATDNSATFEQGDKVRSVSQQLDSMLDGVKCILLQREVPEFVNLLVASRARKLGDVVVLQDVGGEDRPISREMLEACDYIVPNESELRRLVESLGDSVLDAPSDQGEEDIILQQVKILQKHGAVNVLVTRGSRGSTLVTKSGEVLHQPAHQLAPEDVVDETGAGDSYRAAFAVSLLEGRPPKECMAFASAAGACSVMVHGAVPSTPTREMVELRLKMAAEHHHHKHHGEDTVMHIPRGGDDAEFPFLIGSRLNSMKDRRELWQGDLNDARDFVKRQATVRGLTCVDFNYPQHFSNWTPKEARQALDEAGLVAGSVCLRYPSKFARGSFNHPDLELRREAIELTKQAAQAAIELGCNEVVVWSAYDGYDYPFQVDYDEKWRQLVEAFQECCDAFPDIKFSLEYKPTDENTRFFTVPSTGAAILVAEEVDRPNFGLTMDVGHMLMSGENPGQSLAMVARRKKLFGIQLNDGYTRLAAEDGLMFGSVHPSIALEIMYQLWKTGFDGHLYFDTFPQRTDPVMEAEYNIRKVKAFWKAASTIDQAKIREAAVTHDAVAALGIVDEALRRT